MRTILRSAAFGAMLAGLLAPAGRALAQTDSPVGLWKSIDDETKRPKALIRIAEQGGTLVGRIEKVLTDKTDAVCDKCTDERKDKPVMGMTIIRNIKASVEDKGIWDGGDILDPNNGKVYKARLKPVDGGKKLEMRGYYGPFYRTQVWLRVE